MNAAWISRRLPLSGLDVLIDDETTGTAVVLRRESLDVVRTAAELVVKARRACARRLRAARERECRWRQRARARSAEQAAREAAEARDQGLADAARISSALNQTREELLAASEILLLEIADRAVRRLLLDVPAEQRALSSARLLLEAWRAMRGDGVAQLLVHPDDLDCLRDVAAQADWRLLPDGTLERGRCVLTHPAGSLHASYAENVQALLDALTRGRTPPVAMPEPTPVATTPASTPSPQEPIE